MSKLEDQLRESRQEVRSDLQPPAGGWEAIQASLGAAAAGGTAGVAAGAATAAGEAAAVGNVAGAAGGTAGAAAVAGAKSIFVGGLFKAVIGLFLLGGIAAGVWFTLAETPASTPGAEPAPAVVRPELAKDTFSQDNPAPAPTAPASEQEPTPVSSAAEVAATSILAETTGFAQRASERPATTAAKASDDFNPIRENKAVNQQAGGTPAINQSPAMETSGIAAGLEDVPSPAAALPGTLNNDNEIAHSSVQNNDPENGGTASEEGVQEIAAEVDTPSGGFTKAEEPVPSNTGSPIDPLPVNLLRVVSGPDQLIFTGFDDLAGVAEAEGKFRKFKKEVRPSWQLHGGVNLIGSSNAFSFGSGQRLERVENGTGSFNFTLPDGELVSANFSGAFSFSNERTDNIMARVGVTRQTSWGGSWRGTLGFFHGREKQLEDRSLLAANELGFESESRTTALSLEAGFQYTFLRRHKFRPFVGVNGMLFLAYRNTREQFLFDAQTGQRAPQEFNEDRSPIPLVGDLSLTMGFQYQLSNRLSIGPYLWANGGLRYWLEAPFGLEARYIIK